MAYSRKEELAAQDRLAQIWQVSDRSERIALAERFGYGGTDASKLRVMRRLLTGTLKKKQAIDVSSYFDPYITDPMTDIWNGRTPNLKLESKFGMTSYVMYVLEQDGFVTTWEAWLNVGWKILGLPENTPTSSNSMEQLFSDFAKPASRTVGQYKGPRGEKVAGIAFTMEGARELKRMLEDVYGSVIEIPQRAGGQQFGIYMKSVYPDKAGKRMETKTYQRSLPKTIIKSGPYEGRTRRNAMIGYANRSYAQRPKNEAGGLA